MKNEHPFKILAYVNTPDRNYPQPDHRILGVRVGPCRGYLHERVDYVHKVFDHYVQNETFGCALAMRVLQSELYHQLDDTERAECDELVKRWNEYLQSKETL